MVGATLDHSQGHPVPGPPALRGRRLDLPAGGVLACIERVARREAGALAVQSPTGCLTYAGLWHEAEQIAAGLADHGVGSRQGVAVLWSPDCTFVSTLLGIWGAGGYFVPVDPAQPRRRVAAMLERSGVACAVGPEAGQLAGLEVLPWSRLASGSGGGRHGWVKPSPAAIAYLLHTSGSTGEPRGVLVPHRALTNRLVWGQTEYPLDPGDRVLQLASPVYDFALWELFAPLLVGAQVELTEPDLAADPEWAGRRVLSGDITAVHFVPPVLEHVHRSWLRQQPDALRYLFSGGEALPPELAGAVLACTSGRFYNQYGPTETCIDSTAWLVDASVSHRTRTPIGGPIANTDLYVVDEHWAPVGEREVGELLVAGLGLADGYAGDVDATEELFVSLAGQGNGAGPRVYRTGDMVERLPGGLLAFVERRDQQLQVTGVRVEPTEVADSLRALDMVQDVEIQAESTGGGATRLVAEVTAAGGVTAHDVRAAALDVLPRPMIPAEIRLTVDGGQRATGQGERGATAEGAVAGSEVQAQLAAIWSRCLSVESVAPEDSFFDLGGHSLLAARMVGYVQREFGVRIPLRKLFKADTLRQFAVEVEHHLGGAQEASGAAR